MGIKMGKEEDLTRGFSPSPFSFPPVATTDNFSTNHEKKKYIPHQLE